MFKRLLLAVASAIVLFASCIYASRACRMISSGNDIETVCGFLTLLVIGIVDIGWCALTFKEVFRA